jgi:hypothetical protein
VKGKNQQGARVSLPFWAFSFFLLQIWFFRRERFFWSFPSEKLITKKKENLFHFQVVKGKIKAHIRKKLRTIKKGFLPKVKSHHPD